MVSGEELLITGLSKAYKAISGSCSVAAWLFKQLVQLNIFYKNN